MMDESGAVSTVIFFTLLVAGNVGMFIMVMTMFFSSHVMRHATFVNFCAGLNLYSLSYLLLLFTGEIRNSQPRFSLCLTQAAMVYGAGPVVGISGFMFVLYLFLVLRRAVSCYAQENFTKLAMAVMLATPYIVYFIIFIVVIVVGVKNPQTIHRSAYYCTISVPGVAHLAPGISGVALIGIVIIEIMIILTLHQYWRDFRELDQGPSGILTLSFMIRGILFPLISFLGLLACLGFILRFKVHFATNILIAMLPISAFLTFGTQSDLLIAWHLRGEYVSRPRKDQQRVIVAA